MGVGQAQGTVEAALQVIRLLPLIWPQSPCFHHFQGSCPCPVLSWGSIFLSDWPGPRLASLLCSGDCGPQGAAVPLPGAHWVPGTGACWTGGMASAVVEAEGLGGCWAAGAKVLGRSVPTWHHVEGEGV